MGEQKKITIEEECPDCEGTGIRVDGTCAEGAGMKCYTCKGTGCRKTSRSYIPFTGRKERNGIKRVFEPRSWRNLYPDKHTFENGETVDYTQYGCTYEEWKNGVEPKPFD